MQGQASDRPLKRVSVLIPEDETLLNKLNNLPAPVAVSALDSSASASSAAAARTAPARCVHELILSKAAECPEKLAVVFEDQSLTYRELIHRAGCLALHLQRDCGVQAGQDEIIPLCLERSLEMVIGMLGILMAGAAYCPFSPDLPEERRKVMLSDTKARVVVTMQAFAPLFATAPSSFSILRLCDFPFSSFIGCIACSSCSSFASHRFS